MGFLDRIVADLVADSTGLPVRGLVRRAGVKNLLLVGGAVAAGGVAAGALANRSRPSAGPTTAPPPPPPRATPRATSLPPLPNPPAASDLPPIPGPTPSPPGVVADDPDPDTLYAMVRAMVGAALADGSMATEETAAIQGHLGDSGLSPDRQQQIHRDLVLPPSASDIASMCPDGAQESVFRAAVLVTLSDRDLSALERHFLDRLAEALNMAPDDSTRIRDQLIARLTA
jgi:uncharacterized membrane protein YebE (DUF533 family)